MIFSTINSSFPELTEEQIKFLEEELEDHRKNPDKGSTWEDVKTRMTVPNKK